MASSRRPSPAPAPPPGDAAPRRAPEKRRTAAKSETPEAELFPEDPLPAARHKPAKPAGNKPKTGKSRAARKQKPKAVVRLRAWIVVPVAASLMLAWAFQPWSDYSPVEMVAAMDPGRRVETLRRFDDLFPHRMIAVRADAPALRRQEAPIDAVYDWQGERKLAESFIEEANVTGLFVVKDGSIVHERYRLGATAEDRFTTFSLARGVVAVLIGAAIAEGRIASLDDAVETYAAEYAGTDYGRTSLRDLLAMTAGFTFDENYAAPGSDIIQLYVQTLLLGGDPDRLVSRLARSRPAGEAVDLVSPNTQVLSAVVSAVYGAPLAVVVQERIWRPFGMGAPASWSQNRDGRIGSALGFCCWNATLADIGRFGELLRRDGVQGEARLLPEGWLETATAPSGPLAEAGVGGDLGPWGYGLGFLIPADADGEFLLAGEYGQYLWVDKGENTVVAMTAADPGWLDRREEAVAVLRQIVATAGSE
jgi:CubicO group peptidase (beta-lactamase class C family)